MNDTYIMRYAVNLVTLHYRKPHLLEVDKLGVMKTSVTA